MRDKQRPSTVEWYHSKSYHPFLSLSDQNKPANTLTKNRPGYHSFIVTAI